MRRLVFWVLLILIGTLAVPGCQSEATTSNPRVSAQPTLETTLPPSISYFPVALDEFAGTPYPAALTTGLLVLYEGCLRTGGEGAGNPTRVIVWPAGFSVRGDKDNLQVFNQDGTFMARLEDRLAFGGGEVPSQIVEKYTGRPVPAAIKGPFWLTGSVQFAKPLAPPSPSDTPSGRVSFTFKRAIWNWDSIYFFGSANAPDGSRFNIQVYQDGQAVDWWPGYLRVYVLDGKWEVRVKANSWQAPSQFPDFGPGYSLQISDPNDPATRADLALPFPPPTVIQTHDLEDTQWRLVSLNGSQLIPGSGINANFDGINKGTVGGNASVNFYGGKYETDAPNNILIYEMITTAMEGPANLARQEGAYLKCLRDAASFRVVDNQLEIFNDLGERLLVFERTS